MGECNHQQLLNVATEVGFRLLENGAEIYRVEDSICRIVRAYGIQEVDVFAVPTTLIVTINPPDGQTLTKTKRIYSRSTDLDRVYQLNTLSFNIVKETPELEEARHRLDEITNRKDYHNITQMVAFALSAFGFTLFFGGNFMDALCSTSLGVVCWLLGHGLDFFKTTTFFINTLCSAAIAAMAVFWVETGVAGHIDKMVIGAVMTLTPGVALTNSMRDIIAGDLLAGLAKLVDALLAATSIALGAGFILSLHRLIF